MKRKNAAKDSLINRLEIESAARLLRKISRLHNRSVLNLDELIDASKKFLSQLKVRVVDEWVLPKKVDAQAFPKRLLVKIRQGIKDGLLTGHGGARWTLAHELGHVILQHGRHPYRTRHEDTKRPIDRANERAADIFAAALLVPRHLARGYETADQLRAAFQISAAAAKFAIQDIKEEEARNNSPVPEIVRARNEYKARSEYLSQLEDVTARVYLALSQTIDDWNASCSLKIEAFKNNPVGVSALVAVAARLLQEAYESYQRKRASPEYAISASLAAAIHFIRPLREVHPMPTMSKEVQVLNQQCALKIAASALGVTLANIDGAYLRDSDHLGVREYNFFFLKSLVDSMEASIHDTSKLPKLTAFPTYEKYNADYDLCWEEIHGLEDIIDIFLLLKAAQGSGRCS